MHITALDHLTDDLVTLRRYRPTDVAGVKAAITASFDELTLWMPWAQEPPTDTSVIAFVEPASKHFGGDSDATYAITLTEDGRFVGSTGLMQRAGEAALEIGYWVDSRYTRRGIATGAARLLTDTAFAITDVDRVEICCDENNIASAKVPERLRYRLDRYIDRSADAPSHTGRGMVWVMERASWNTSR